MNRKEQVVIIEDLFKSCLAILGHGSREYANDIDVLRNFNGVAADLGLTPEEVCFIYLKKHIDGIATYVRTKGEPQRDTIYGRIIDATNYLGLLYCIFAERDSSRPRNDSDIRQADMVLRRGDSISSSKTGTQAIGSSIFTGGTQRQITDDIDRSNGLTEAERYHTDPSSH